MSDYDKRTVGHLAACENHQNLLLYLAQETKFNFELEDRFGRNSLDEIRDEKFKAKIVNILGLDDRYQI